MDDMTSASPTAAEPFPGLAARVDRAVWRQRVLTGGVFSSRQSAGEEAPTAAAEVAEPRPAAEEAEPVSVTLAQLYISQGHREEARRVLAAVLERHPDHPRAAALAVQLDERRRLRAVELLGERHDGESRSERRRRLLMAYLERIRSREES